MDVAPTLGFLKQEVEGREKRSGADGSKLLSLGGSSVQEKKGGGSTKGVFLWAFLPAWQYRAVPVFRHKLIPMERVPY